MVALEEVEEGVVERDECDAINEDREEEEGDGITGDIEGDAADSDMAERRQKSWGEDWAEL